MQQSPASIDALPEETRMELLLWRHADAEDGYPDAKRKLTERGEQQAQQIAEWLQAHAPKDLRIIVSPALRCQQTAQALQLPFTTDKRVGTEGNPTNLLAAIGWPDGGAKAVRQDATHPAILVVGHQPTLGQAAALLLAGKEAYWTIKKGALWWLSNRTRKGETQTVLRAVIPPELC